MAVVKLVDTSQYEFKVFTDGKAVRPALEDDAPEAVIAFAMRRMSRAEKVKLDDSLMTRNGMKLGTYQLEAIRKCVVGWSGMFDEQGEEIKFAQQNLDRLPPVLFSLLDDEVAEANGLKAEAEKN